MILDSMMGKNRLFGMLFGMVFLALFLVQSASALSISVALSSTPALPSPQAIGNIVVFNALATGGSGIYLTYSFLVFNSVTNTVVGYQSSSSNSFTYTVNGLVGDTQFANVVVVDSGSNTVNSINSGMLTVVTGITCPSCHATAVNLRTAGDFAAFADQGISFSGTTPVIGDIGLGPAVTSTSFTGFSQTQTNTIPLNTYATSTYVIGRMYAYDYAVPTPANVGTAAGDMLTAYTNAQGETNPTASELGAGIIGGMTLAPGLYKWSSGVTIPITTTLTLDAQGDPNALWVFQIAGAFSNLGNVVLINGAQAKNVYWAVAGAGGPIGVTLGSGSSTVGTILSSYTIAFSGTGAALNGRALSQTTVTLAGNTGTFAIPAGSAVPPFAINTVTTLTSNDNPAALGDTITFTANVIPSAGSIPNNELITYYDGATVIGTGNTVSGLYRPDG